MTVEEAVLLVQSTWAGPGGTGLYIETKAPAFHRCLICCSPCVRLGSALNTADPHPLLKQLKQHGSASLHPGEVLLLTTPHSAAACQCSAVVALSGPGRQQRVVQARGPSFGGGASTCTGCAGPISTRRPPSLAAEL